jgi:hypothetical protein
VFFDGTEKPSGIGSHAAADTGALVTLCSKAGHVARLKRGSLSVRRDADKAPPPIQIGVMKDPSIHFKLEQADSIEESSDRTRF